MLLCRTAQECATLQQQLSAAQHKVTKLTAARDKLEIVLHDLETISADECQQLEQQLASANKALRSSGQQLTDTQRQLNSAQQELAGTQKQLQETQQQLADAHQLTESLHEQNAAVAAELQQLQEQLASCSAAAMAAATAATAPAVDNASAQVGGRHDWLQALGQVAGGPPHQHAARTAPQPAVCWAPMLPVPAAGVACSTHTVCMAAAVSLSPCPWQEAG